MALVTKSFSDIITFTRASNATQFNSAGTLVYAPHNIVTWSEDFTNAAWVKTNTTISGNATTAPNNTLTADRISIVDDNFTAEVTQTITVIDNITIIFSCYLKYSGEGLNNSVYLSARTKANVFLFSKAINLSTGILSGTGSAETSTSVTDVGSGWYRLVFTVNSIGTGATTPTVGIYADPNPFIGDNLVFAWGAQLNVAALQSYNQTTSSAYYGPRLDYSPSTLAAQGLLIEESRTNNLIWSDSFRARQLNVTVTAGTFQDGETVTATGGGVGTYVAADSTATSFAIYNLTVDSAWTGTLTGSTSGATATINSVVNIWGNGVNTTFTRDTQTAPDGTTTADTMAASTVGTFSRFTTQQFSTSTQGAWTFSVFVKKGTLTNNLIAIRVRDNTGTHAFWANFNLSTLAVPTVFIDGGAWVAGTSTVTPCQNGWVRISISGTVNTVVTAYRPEIWLGGYQNVAETIGTAFVWGAQFEAGAFPTSYIPTTTTALTRSADDARVNVLSPWYNQSAGTLFVERIRGPLDAVAARRYVNISDGSAGTNVAFQKFQGSTGTSNAVSYVAGVSDFAPNPAGASAEGAIVKTALAIDNTGKAMSRDGGTVATSAVLPALSGMTTMFIGGNGNLAGNSCTWIRRITYYPRKLSSAELQAITA